MADIFFNRRLDDAMAEHGDITGNYNSVRGGYDYLRSEARATTTRRPVKHLSSALELHLKSAAKLARTPASNRQIAFLATLIENARIAKHYVNVPADKPLSKSDASALIDKLKRFSRR